MMVYLTRRYWFCASHRLHNDLLTAEENARIYGKCNSPYGHGHNYALEVTLAGPVDPASGMVCNLGLVDEVVAKEVLEPFDHANLNQDVESFRSRVPTAENLCVEIFRLLREKLASVPLHPARLERIRLEETGSNFFEYEGELDGGGR